jgi:hypothetical protein
VTCGDTLTQARSADGKVFFDCLEPIKLHLQQETVMSPPEPLLGPPDDLRSNQEAVRPLVEKLATGPRSVSLPADVYRFR